jgi:hypothetical protein
MHPMQIGMLEHIEKWIFHFMKTYDHLDKYNAIWLSMPRYYDLTRNNRLYDEVSQWTGKETKEMSQYLLGVETQSLKGGNSTEHPIFNRAIECTRAMLEFYMYARYKSYNDGTLSYLEPCIVFTPPMMSFYLGEYAKRQRPKPMPSELNS